MKTYTLETKYVPTKEIFALAVLGCVYNAAVSSNKLIGLNVIDKFKHNFQALFDAITYVTRLSIDQKEILNRNSDNLRYIMAQYSKIPEYVKNLCDVLPEPVEIIIKGPFMKPDLKQFVPEFPEDKIKISYTYENENLPA